MRQSNAADRSRVIATLPDNLAGIADSLPVLRTGEAIITGESARLPLRCRIALPAEDHRPSSEDADVSNRWAQSGFAFDYGRVAASWRAQNPRWVARRVTRTATEVEDDATMKRQQVQSSNLVSVGYEDGSSTLEIEFKGGALYQYYNVPAHIHDGLMAADSKGSYFHANIKDLFPYSRV
jgi:hypothetical protein